MGLVTWIKSKLLLRKNYNEESVILALREEIEKLKKENATLKEKVIVFPKKDNEKISIKFFDENIEDTIVKNICEAREELCIAVAWFTSQTLMDELNTLKRKGVNIKVIVNNDEINKKNINKLESVCNIVKKVLIPKRENQKRSNFMHHKYCIIDNKKVIDGSYNWSKKAKYNLEHIIVIEGSNVAKMYKNSFDKIYNNPEYYGDYYRYDALG